ncbi:hypothetical protein DRQ07_02885 [candidate division KSB1 bacterium]|nr:MAG: hypothetical protein DRQ07_02885 [candidate division KSB1 bacterium]
MFTEEFIRIVNAAKKFKIKDDFEFIGFDEITPEGLSEHKNLPDIIEMWAAIKIFFEGTLPESYKSLNLMIGDWVEKNEQKISKVLYPELHDYFEKKYPRSDSSDFKTKEFEEESVVWLDQLDYMPIIDENENSLIIEVELVLNAEPLGK